jgi:signal transduction histidine kinase/DNA-binding NarL/FixJ family response regulator
LIRKSGRPTIRGHGDAQVHGRAEVIADVKTPAEGRSPRAAPPAGLGAWLVGLAVASLAAGAALAVEVGAGGRNGWAWLAAAFAALGVSWAASGARRAARAPAPLTAGAPPAREHLTPRVRALTEEIESVRAELDARSRRGEEADRLKSLFIANMSHEIRTPLNSVLALTQLLREGVAGPLVADQRRYLEVIERNGQNLLRLINDILDLSRIEAGHVEVDIQDLPLGPVVAEVVDTLSPLAQRKDLELAVRMPDPPPRVHGDVDRLRQILNNLVGNAIKFTDAGMVQVAVETRDGEVSIQVIDTGIGIAEADIGKIFREFFQVDQTLARRQGGTGLGLPIAIRLARLMGGDITVSSVPGSGSRFTLTLPRAPDRPAAAGATVGGRTTPTGRAAEEVPGGPGPGVPIPRVLLVEDNEDNLFTLRQVLGRLPIQIETATSGRQAIEICRRALPDLIVMDVQMPGMSGLQTTGAIRALRGGGEVPIIALTAQAMRGDRERILAAGCDEYLAKPVDPKALRAAVERLVEGRPGAPRDPAAPAGAKQKEGERHDAHTPRR